ncbi:MAG TPA: M20/M25/M40 family metallo-hydrolase [Pyrinomonadaceae bacterium]|nr:M20/M25/M40 family metallo-hydrolase [Pyrinomonadaceae bacterium]
MPPTIRQQTTSSVKELLAATEVVKALSYFDENADRITEEHIRISSVPAGPFNERQRADYLHQKFVERGLQEVTIDGEGNCLGLFSGESTSPLFVVSAHLDTVFSHETDFRVHRRGQRLFGPGISDDSSGLVALIAIIDALNIARVKTRGSILFVGTVGEEGEGNLRGVRHLLTVGPWSSRVDAFLSFDGPGVDRITNRALGSRRYRIEVTGSGGHSWGDFGIPNPIHALGRAISRLAAYPIPKNARTTFNVGRIEGGTSVNAIPSFASLEVDLRSAVDAELRRLDAYFRRAAREAVDDENAQRRPGDQPLILKLELTGERPTGGTPPDSPLVELAIEATRTQGIEPKLDQSSTDSNLPISLGIPAITLGSGGNAAGSHTLDEWYEPEGRALGLKRGLLVILGMTGLSQSNPGV